MVGQPRGGRMLCGHRAHERRMMGKQKACAVCQVCRSAARRRPVAVLQLLPAGGRQRSGSRAVGRLRRQQENTPRRLLRPIQLMVHREASQSCDAALLPLRGGQQLEERGRPVIPGNLY
jgi:hypothetical protein